MTTIGHERLNVNIDDQKTIKCKLHISLCLCNCVLHFKVNTGGIPVGTLYIIYYKLRVVTPTDGEFHTNKNSILHIKSFFFN